MDITSLKKYAADLGLNSGKFNSCLDSGEKAAKVQADFQEGQRMGVRGTPSFFINERPLVGAQPFEAFKSAIDAELAGEPVPVPTPEPTPEPEPTEFSTKIVGDPVKGSEDAKIAIVEWSDFECSFCSRFYRDTLPQITENYIDTGKVKLYYRHFPLSFHAQATPSAEASECAHEQDMFWEMHDKMYENQNALSVANYKAWAAELGMDEAQFNDCVDSRKYQSQVQQDMADGSSSGVRGTPGFVVGVIQEDGSILGQSVRGAQPYNNFKTIIDAELAKV